LLFALPGLSGVMYPSGKPPILRSACMDAESASRICKQGGLG
jgi:hypothetical protein